MQSLTKSKSLSVKGTEELQAHSVFWYTRGEKARLNFSQVSNTELERGFPAELPKRPNLHLLAGQFSLDIFPNPGQIIARYLS